MSAVAPTCAINITRPVMRKRAYEFEPAPAWLIWATVAGLLLSLLFMTIGAAHSRELALGDCLALGFGRASPLPTRAIVGTTCPAPA